MYIYKDSCCLGQRKNKDIFKIRRSTKRFVFFKRFCCSIQNKPWSFQSAEEIKLKTMICPLEDESLKNLTLELVPSRLSKKCLGALFRQT